MPVEPAEQPKAEKATVAAGLSGDFVACSTFAGKRDGYVFKLGAKGVGYYADAARAKPATALLAGRAGNGANRRNALDTRHNNKHRRR